MSDKKSRVLSEIELHHLLAKREVVVCVFENELYDKHWGVVECQAIGHDNGISFASSGHYQVKYYSSLEEAVLREVVEHGRLKVLCVNTSQALKMRYFTTNDVYLRTKSTAHFFCDFQRPCGFDLLQTGVEVCELM